MTAAANATHAAAVAPRRKACRSFSAGTRSHFWCRNVIGDTSSLLCPPIYAVLMLGNPRLGERAGILSFHLQRVAHVCDFGGRKVDIRKEGSDLRQALGQL